MSSVPGRLTSLLLACAIAPAILWAQNIEERGDEAKISALERVRNRAEASGDLKALDALLDSELIYIDSDGSLMTKPDFLSKVKSAPPQRTIIVLTKVQVFEDTAIVNGTYQSKEFRNGKPLFRQGQFTDTWIYKGSAWVCIAAQNTLVLR